MSYLQANAGGAVRGPGLRQGRDFEVRGLGSYGVYGLGAWEDDAWAKWFQFRPVLVAAINESNEAEGGVNAATYSNNLLQLDRAVGKAIAGEIPREQFQHAGDAILSALSRPVDTAGQLFWAQVVEGIQNAPVDAAKLIGKMLKGGAEGAGVNLGVAVYLVPAVIGIVALAYLFKK